MSQSYSCPINVYLIQSPAYSIYTTILVSDGAMLETTSLETLFWIHRRKNSPPSNRKIAQHDTNVTSRYETTYIYTLQTISETTRWKSPPTLSRTPSSTQFFKYYFRTLIHSPVTKIESGWVTVLKKPRLFKTVHRIVGATFWPQNNRRRQWITDIFRLRLLSSTSPGCSTLSIHFNFSRNGIYQINVSIHDMHTSIL